MKVLVDRSGPSADQGLADKGPGHQLQVSSVVGQGYASLFNSYVRLLSAMEESRNLILIGTRFFGVKKPSSIQICTERGRSEQ